jgi:predicted enzyme related to lactoylglutathione lyase
LGSVVKINHHVHQLPAAPPSGYRELMISRKLQSRPESLIDPDGNRVCIVPKGHERIDQIGIRLYVRDLESHRRFYTHALGLQEEDRLQGAAFRAGETLIILEQQTGLPAVDGVRVSGWGYITLQVCRVDEAHAGILNAGGQEGMAPTTVGTTARISMVLDPDKNRIELSQCASIVGTLAQS